MKESNYIIASIIASYLKGNISTQQQTILNEWLHASIRHRQLFHELQDKNANEKMIRELLNYDIPTAWNKVQRKVVRRKQRKNYIMAMAAMLVILIGSTFLIKLNSNHDSIHITTPLHSDIVPGHAVARFTSSSGDKYQLDEQQQVVLPDSMLHNGTALVINADKLSRTSTSKTKQLNKLEVPRGGEYRICLSDKTWVYLNSETVLRFPDSFDSDAERVVYLQGEAYFEVTNNQKKPFIVKCSNYEVKVLGTSFNISDYSDNPFSHTTLQYGSVEINRNGKSTRLKPGQQAKITASTLEVRKVDVENYTTWMNNSFRFESENIEVILQRLARWYDVHFFYTNQDIKQYHFSGYLPRYSDISEVLQLLTLTTNIDFEINGKTITVKKK